MENEKAPFFGIIVTLNIPYKNQNEKFRLVTESGPVDIIVDKSQAVNRLCVGDASKEESDLHELKCPEDEEESTPSAEEVDGENAVPGNASKWVEVKQSKSSITEFVQIFTKAESHDASIKMTSVSTHHQPKHPRRETPSKEDKAIRAKERNKRKVEKRKIQRQVRVTCFSPLNYDTFVETCFAMFQMDKLNGIVRYPNKFLQPCPICLHKYRAPSLVHKCLARHEQCLNLDTPVQVMVTVTS